MHNHTLANFNLQVQWDVTPKILKNMPNMQMNMSPWEVEGQPSDEELAQPNITVMKNNTSCSSRLCDIDNKSDHMDVEADVNTILSLSLSLSPPWRL